MKRKVFVNGLLLFFLTSICILGLLSKTILGKSIQKKLQHEVTVTLKLIQVYVTDKSGKPEMDLVQDDFEIYDNGKRKRITEFEKYMLTIPVEEKAVNDITKADLTQKPLLFVKMNRKFFLFFDFAFNNATGVKKSKKAALHFIDTQLKPTDEVGIFSYSHTKGFKLHEYLTNNHTKVRDVVEGFGVKDFLGRIDNVEQAFWAGSMYFKGADKDGMTGGKPLGAPSSSGFTKRYSTPSMLDFKLQISSYISQISNVSKAFRYIPGRKHIILFSSGIPSSVMYGVGAPFGSMRKGSLGDTAIRNYYESLMKELSTSNSPVYVLNSEELKSSIHMDEQLMGGYSLKKMAKETGGKYYAHVHDYEKNLKELNTLTGSYYVLGYYINERWDGKYHMIKVKVKRSGLKVHAQGGYYNPKLFTKYSDLEKFIHLIDLALTERPLFQDPLKFELLAEVGFKEKRSFINLSSEIPHEILRELTGNKIEIVALVFDEQENVEKLKREEVDLSKSTEGYFAYSEKLTIRPGTYKCRVVIRNLETGRGAVASAKVLIPEIKN